jgi:hypothetical protein
MLDLRQYSCLGEALRDALDRWPDEICLIEADRDKEKAASSRKSPIPSRERCRTRVSRMAAAPQLS